MSLSIKIRILNDFCYWTKVKRKGKVINTQKMIYNFLRCNVHKYCESFIIAISEQENYKLGLASE